MCALNLVLTVFVACFIVLPQLLVGHGLDVPDSIRGNTSALSIIIDGRVSALVVYIQDKLYQGRMNTLGYNYRDMHLSILFYSTATTTLVRMSHTMHLLLTNIPTSEN